MTLDPTLWRNAIDYVFPKHREIGDRVLLINLFALLAALWLIFPVKRLPDFGPGSVRVTLKDLIVHETLSENVMQAPAGVSCCSEVYLGLHIESPPGAELHVDASPSDSPIRLRGVDRFITLLHIEPAYETATFVAVRLNSEPVEFELDGRAGRLHELKLERGISYRLPIAVVIPAPGVHRIEAIAYQAPVGFPLAWLHHLFGSFQVTGTYRSVAVEGAPDVG